MEARTSLRIEIEHRTTKTKPLMLLKDYLLDDLSSCSSNGFMSFPRRQRRSTTSASIRLLIDIDLRNGIPSATKTNNKKSLNRPSSSSSSSLFRTVAVKLINAVKSPLWDTCFLPHSGRAARKFLTSKPKVKTDVSATGEGEGKVGGTGSRDCVQGEAIDPCSKEWLMGKQQSSPVSVLDDPFDDGDDDDDVETDPHPISKPAKLLHRRGRRHGGEEETDRLNESTCRRIGEESREDAEAVIQRMLETVKADIPSSYDSKAEVLVLDLFREKMEEWGGENGYAALRRRDRFEAEAVRTAEAWVRGDEARETYLGWEMEGGRMVYLKDMERGNVRWNEMGNHPSYEDSERYEVGLEVEDVVWTLLMYEVLLDIPFAANSCGQTLMFKY